MISVKINRDYNRNITNFTVEGHANAEEYGRDIVCASIAILAQTAVLALNELLDIDVNYEMDDGWLYCELPQLLDEDIRTKANIILDTMVLGIKGTQEMYSDFIEFLDKEV